MISKINKNAVRQKRHVRVRSKISGTAEKPRLSVYRSTNEIYAQVIDDVQGVTLVACSTIEKKVASKVSKVSKTEAAKIIGQEIAKRAIDKGVKEVVFDRGGYLYTGRVAALAEGAREVGLVF